MISPHKRNASPQRVAQLLQVHSVGEVASILCIASDEVVELAESAGRPRITVVIRNNRNGKTARARSWRGAYRLAQQMGFADWDWWEEKACGKA